MINDPICHLFIMKALYSVASRRAHSWNWSCDLGRFSYLFPEIGMICFSLLKVTDFDSNLRRCAGSDQSDQVRSLYLLPKFIQHCIFINDFPVGCNLFTAVTMMRPITLRLTWSVLQTMIWIIQAWFRGHIKLSSPCGRIATHSLDGECLWLPAFP